MAYSIISKPNSISLSGNLNDIIIQTKEQVAFTMKKGSETLLDEIYMPADDGIITVKLKSYIDSLLKVSYPIGEVFEQTGIFIDFTYTLNTDSYTFRCIKGGVDTPSFNEEVFLSKNFLTWQPILKKVNFLDPEWLTYYTIESCVMKACATFSDGSEQTITRATLAAGKCYTVDQQFKVLASKFQSTPSKVKVWIENSSGVVMSYVQTYELVDEHYEFDDIFIFQNSLSGIDSIRFTGTISDNHEPEIGAAVFGERNMEYSITLNNSFTKNTGLFPSERYRLWANEFFSSTMKFHISTGYVKPIVMRKVDAKGVASDLNSYSFTFAYESQTQYQNLARQDSLSI